MYRPQGLFCDDIPRDKLGRTPERGDKQEDFWFGYRVFTDEEWEKFIDRCERAAEEANKRQEEWLHVSRTIG